MLLYADVTYYTSEQHAGAMSDIGRIKENLFLASRDVDRLTFGRIKKIGFDNLTEEQQELVKKACCYQADYLSSDESAEADIASYSAGNISISYKTDAKTAAQREKVSETAYKLLSETGLMHRCI